MRTSLLALALAVFLPGSLFGQGVGIPKHAWANGVSFMPEVMPNAATDTATDVTHIQSFGAKYYYQTAGNPKGRLTNKAASSGSGLVDDITSAVGVVGHAVTGVTAKVAAAQSWLNRQTDLGQGTSPTLWLTPEQMAVFTNALSWYKLFQQYQTSKNGWSDSLFTIDILGILPTAEIMELDDFGVPKNNLRLSLRYKDGSNDVVTNVFGANPFLKDGWRQTKFRYVGPHKFSDLDVQVEASPYEGVDAPIKIGVSALEQMDRNFFEAVMGRSQALDGVTLSNADTSVTRPTPMLLKKRAESIASRRLDQIYASVQQDIALGMDSQKALDAYKDELEYWRTYADRLYESQVARITRLRNEVRPTLSETVSLESEERRAIDGQQMANGFLSNVFTSLQNSKELADDLMKGLGLIPDDTGDNSGPRQIYTAHIQIAKATFASYEEAAAIRRMLHSELTRKTAGRVTEEFSKLSRLVEHRAADTKAITERVSAMRTSVNNLQDKLAQMGLQVEDVRTIQ